MYGEFMFTVIMPRICHDQGASLPLSRVGNVKSIAAVVTDPDCILSQSVFLRIQMSRTNLAFANGRFPNAFEAICKN